MQVRSWAKNVFNRRTVWLLVRRKGFAGNPVFRDVQGSWVAAFAGNDTAEFERSEMRSNFAKHAGHPGH
jgi:hypothetical protein